MPIRLEVRCIDRLMLTFRQPRLQYGQGIHGFFCQHRQCAARRSDMAGVPFFLVRALVRGLQICRRPEIGGRLPPAVACPVRTGHGPWSGSMAG